MTTWIFEPGHTEAEFRAPHMMVTWVRGLFKDIHGRLELNWDSFLHATFEGEIDAAGIWTGERARDDHLRSADFFDVQDELPGGGVVVSNEIDLTIDVEAISLDDLERTGAIEYYIPTANGR